MAITFLSLSLLAALIGSSLLCLVFIKSGFLQDEVTARSSHIRATSRAGGFAILVSFMVVGVIYLVFFGGNTSGPNILFLLLLILGAGLLGLADDFKKVGHITKFSGQFILAIAAATLWGGDISLPIPFAGMVELGVFSYIVAALWVLSFINVFNFLDGLNGIAAGCALVALIFIAYMALQAGQFVSVFTCLILFFATLGFFFWNFPKGRIFMGDAGSHAIGFAIAALALIGTQPVSQNGASTGVVFIPIVFLPFIYDATITLIRRRLAKEPIFEAHKGHYYQRLHQKGWAHWQVSLLYMGGTALAGWIAILTIHESASNQWLGLALLLCGFSAVMRFLMERC